MALVNHQHVQGSEQKHAVREDGLSQCCTSGVALVGGCNTSMIPGSPRILEAAQSSFQFNLMTLL